MKKQHYKVWSVAMLWLFAFVIPFAQKLQAQGAQPPNLLINAGSGTEGGTDLGRTVAYDASGNWYIAGSFYGITFFGSQILVSAGDKDIFIAKYNSSGVLQWARRAGGTSSDEASSIAISGTSVYITGYFGGTANFNTPSSGSSNTLISSGSSDIFVAKFNDDGTFFWARRAGGTGSDEARGIAVSGSSLYISGVFYDIANFNTPSSENSNMLTSAGSADIFVAKFNDAGTFAWARRAGGTTTDEANGIAVSDVSVYITGNFGGTANFNTPSDGSSNTLISAGDSDILVAKFSDVGTFAWARRAGGTTTDKANGIAVSDNSVYITGRFEGTANFNTPSNGSSNTIIRFGAASSDIFVAKFNDAGTFSWARRAGGTRSDEATSIAISDTSVYITGRFEGTANFNTPSNGSSNAITMAGVATTICDIFVAKFNDAGTFVWARRAGGTSSDYSNGIAVSDTLVHITGYFAGIANFNTPSSSASNTITSAGINDIFAARYSHTGSFIAATSAGAPEGGSDSGSSVAYDAFGNIYVVGSFTGTATFGSQVLASAGNVDIFIAKYNSNGVLQWARRAGGIDIDYCMDIAISGNSVYVTGRFYNIANFNTPSSQSSNTLTSIGEHDIFVAKFSDAGVFAWARRAGGGTYDEGSDIFVSGNSVYITGYFGGTANFNTPSNASRNTLISAGGSDIFVAKFSDEGAFVWARRAGGTSYDAANGIDVLGTSVYLTGRFQTTANFNTPSNESSNTLISAGVNDIFVAKFSDTGNFQWAYRAGGADDDAALDIAVSGTSLYITGYFEGTTNFNTPSNGSSNTLISNGGLDIFVAKFSDEGTFAWARRAGGASADYGLDIVVSGTSVYLTGRFQATANFNTPSSENSNTIISAGSSDIFVAKFNDEGTFAWASRAGGTGLDISTSIAVSGSSVYITGSFENTANFNTPSNGSSNTITSAGWGDIFVARYGEIPPTTWNGSAWDNGVPTTTIDAIINGNYSTTANGNISCKGLTINNTNTFFVASTGTVTTTNGITNNGIINSCGGTIIGTVTGNATVVLSAPSIGTQPQAQTVTVGDNVTLSVGVTGNGLSYQWKKGAANVGTNSNTLVLNNVALADADNYSVVVTGTCGNAMSSSVALVVNCPVIDVPIISASSTTLPFGGSVTLTAFGSADAYLWNNGAETQSITVSNAGSYSVQAISGECTSAVSAATEVTVNNNLTFNSCGADIVVSGTRLGSTVFFMEWTPNPSVFSSYRIQWRRTDLSAGWSATPTYDGTRSAFKIENLLPDTEYEFRFQVTCTATGTLTNTNAVVVRTKNVLCSVESLGVDTIGRNNIWIGWTASAGIATYEVSVKAASATTWGNGVFITNSPAAPVSGVKIKNLLAGTAYSYRVRATCNNGYQDLTRFFLGQFTTLSNVACAAITPTSSAQSTNSISVVWNGSSSYKAYIVRWQAAGSTSWKTSSTITTNSFDITGLSSGVAYAIQVQGQCVTMGEWTDFGGVLNAQASSSSTCSTPAIDSLKASATRSVSVFWTAASNISQYEISRRPLGGTWNAPIVVAGTANRANLSSTWFAPTFGNSFEVRVRARCADNNTFVAYQTQTITLAGAARVGIAPAINLNVYPNPSTGVVNIAAENLNEVAMYYVYNAMGQMVASGEIASETAIVDLSAQANGMYLLKVVANGAVQTKQVVINR